MWFRVGSLGWYSGSVIQGAALGQRALPRGERTQLHSRFGMAEDVLADAALRHTSGTSSSALGYSNFTGFRESSIAFSASTLIGFTRD